MKRELSTTAAGGGVSAAGLRHPESHPTHRPPKMGGREMRVSEGHPEIRVSEDLLDLLERGAVRARMIRVIILVIVQSLCARLNRRGVVNGTDVAGEDEREHKADGPHVTPALAPVVAA
jgi:hypothetical protein